MQLLKKILPFTLLVHAVIWSLKIEAKKMI